MLTFKQYLQEGSIKDPQILSRLLKTEYMQSLPYLTGKNRIYRGFHSDSYGRQYAGLPWFELDAPINRRSANTSNWYTDIFSHTPSWKGWPKRSSSIVCTTDENKADNYATQGIYRIIPHPGTLYASANVEDIWDAPIKFLSSYSVDLVSVNRQLQDVLFNHDGPSREIFRDLCKEYQQYAALQYASKLLAEDSDEGQALRDAFNEAFSLSPRDWDWKEWTNDRLLKEVDVAFNPTTLGFTKATADGTLHGAGELWFQGKCLCINMEYIEDAISLGK